MAIFEKSSSGISGSWAKGADVQEHGSRSAKIVSEAQKVNSEYQGKPQTQTVAKVQFEGFSDALNTKLNRATVDALIDAFGKESAGWQGHPLAVQVEKVNISGKNHKVIYLIPEGFELTEDEGGYTVIVRKGQPESLAAFNAARAAAGDEGSPSEIPF